MNTNSKKVISVFLSLLMTFICMTSVEVSADYIKSGSKMIFYFSSVTASAGQDIQLDLYVDNKIAIQEMNDLILTIPDGFEITEISDTSPAFNGSVSYKISGNNLNFSIKSDGTINSENIVSSIYLHISENCAEKAYSFVWNTNAMSCITADGYNYSPIMSYGLVTVGNSGGTTATTVTTAQTTTTTTTETTTTTATTQKHTYSVYFVDEETNQAVSGIKYNIRSYYVFDPVQVVQTSGENPKSFEFISDTAYVSLTTVEKAIPDGYYIPNDATRWELSDENPDLTVYLRKAETTTTTETTTTSETTTTTTASTYFNVIIDSYPKKTAYTIGEELDLSSGTFHAEGMDQYGRKFWCVKYKMTNTNVDISEFDNTKAGTYRIYIKWQIDTPIEAYSETFFEVTVTDNTGTLNFGDINNDGFIDSVDASIILTEYALLSTSGVGKFNEQQNHSADLNKDGEINSVDASLVLAYYAYISTNGSNSLEIWLTSQHEA